MKYDFTSIIDRRGEDAAAVDGIGKKVWGDEPGSAREGFDPIPMWVADMNFATCPTIPASIIERARHPLYGYFYPSDAYYDAIIQWQTERNNFEGLRPEYIGHENGVLGGVISALNVFCSKGDHVLIHSPTYVGFSESLTNNGYNSVLSPLRLDGDNIWRMDFEDMEEKIIENRIHAAVFCSPHNPCGRVWDRWEIEQFIELCRKYDIYVVSDEIWSDLTFGNHQHIPTQMVNEDARQRTVALYAPSKTFNLAGLVGSYHIIYNRWIRERVIKESSLAQYNEMNVLSMHALIGAYSQEGREWTDELRQVLEGNCKYACEHIWKHYGGVEVSMPQGTYMLFLDLTEYCHRTGKTLDQAIKAGWDVGVGWQDGRAFHGPCHIRMNLASPLSRIQEAFDRLDKYVFNG